MIVKQLLLIGIVVMLFGDRVNALAKEQTEGPVHVSLICKAGQQEQPGCTERERLAALQLLLSQGGMKVGGSNLTLWEVGDDPNTIQPLLTICVPATWGSGPQAAKVRFAEMAQTMMTSVTPAKRMTLPQDCTPPRSSKGAREEVVLSADLPSSWKEWNIEWTNEGFVLTCAKRSSSALQALVAKAPKPLRRQPHHLAAVCDRSGSTDACRSAIPAEPPGPVITG